MSCYLKVRRKKKTVFLYVDLVDTVSAVKDRLGKIIEKPAAEFRLLHGEEPLDEVRTLEELNVRDQDEVFIVFKTGEDEYEEKDVEYPVAAGAEDADAAAAAQGEAQPAAAEAN